MTRRLRTWITKRLWSLDGLLWPIGTPQSALPGWRRWLAHQAHRLALATWPAR